MLDHLHTGEEIELSVELLHVPDAVVDLETLPPRVIARDPDHFRSSVEAGHFGAETGERLSQQPCAAAHIESRLPLQRPAAALVTLPMLVDHVADIFEPHGVEFVQHR